MHSRSIQPTVREAARCISFMSFGQKFRILDLLFLYISYSFVVSCAVSGTLETFRLLLVQKASLLAQFRLFSRKRQ